MPRRLDGAGDNPLTEIKGGVMNDTSGSDPAEHATPAQSTHSPAPPPAPWGLLGTIAWGTAGFLAEFAVQFVVLATFMRLRDVTAPPDLANNGLLMALVFVLSGPVSVGVAALAARMRGWRVRDYLALVAPRRGQLLFGIACLAALQISFGLLTSSFGAEEAPAFMREEYQSARVAGALPLFFLAAVVVAPIAEEIAFRGFLFRGLSETWLGVAGTVVVTSAAWTLDAVAKVVGIRVTRSPST
jgi:membrane protease YdiL (CAAX protease family)